MSHQHHPQPDAPATSQPGLVRFVVNIGAVFVFSVPALCALFLSGLLLTALTGSIGFLTSFFVLIGFVLIASALRRLHHERMCRLLNYLKLATGRNLPLPEFLDALRRGEGFGISVRAERIAGDLRLGSSLGAALIEHAPEVPVHQSAVILRGEQAGRLSEAVARVADNLNTESRTLQSARNDVALQYALVIFVILLAMAAFIGARILPVFAEIFFDYEAELPRFTIITFELVSQLSWFFLIAAIIGLLGVIGWATHGLFLTSETITGPLRRLLEPVLWRVPVLSNSLRSRALADACFTIEQAMRAGRPLPDAIDAARYPLQSRVMSRRLERFAAGLRKGQAMTDAARSSGLPALIVGMLGMASAAAKPADVFAFLCRYYTQRVSPVETLVKAAAMPLITLTAAACVAWVVLAIFYPLITLIEASIEATGMA